MAAQSTLSNTPWGRFFYSFDQSRTPDYVLAYIYGTLHKFLIGLGQGVISAIVITDVSFWLRLSPNSAVPFNVNTPVIGIFRGNTPLASR